MTVLSQLILAHERMAYQIASRYRHPNLEREDLKQIALVGLVKAVDKFDPARGVPFGAFASFSIREELAAALWKAGIICWPAYAEKTRPGQRIGVRSLGAMLPNHAVDPYPGPDVQAAARETWSYLTSCLSEQQQQLVDLVYRQDMTLAEACSALGLSAEQGRALHRQTLTWLRRHHAASGARLKTPHRRARPRKGKRAAAALLSPQ